MKSLLVPLFHLVLVTVAAGQTIFNQIPDWISADTPFSTGAALVDLDRDGWPDLIVSNGNDMRRERLVVYYNLGDGTYPPTPDWQSADVAYHGHLDVADVDGDGWPDVAVAVLLNEGGAAAKLYMNENGTLTSLPAWTSQETERAFGVAFGDVNNDGRPDLAVATGWPYNPGFEARNTVHLNLGGQLEQIPSWQSDDLNHYLGVLWVDADDDGWLDLVGIGANTHTWIYRNDRGSLETTATWNTADNGGQFAIMATAGDVNGDGYRELFVTDNNQLFSGSGLHRQYSGLSGGQFTQTPTWSYFDGNGSAMALADVDGDGDLDLATGAWWSYTRLFLNNESGFASSPDWQSSRMSVIEKIVFADIDKNSLRSITESFGPAGGRRLFYLAHQPIQELVSVLVDGTPLTPTQYTMSREHGWVSVGVAPASGIQIEYTCSTKLDMAVANWDDSEGNHVYYNRLIVQGDANCDGVLDVLDVGPFVLLLVDRTGYLGQFPDCHADTFCDMNDDNRLDGGDIQLFVERLLVGP